MSRPTLKVGQTVYTLEQEVTQNGWRHYCRVYAIGNRVISHDDTTIAARGKYGITFISWDSDNLYLTEEAVVRRLQEILAERDERVKKEGQAHFINGLCYYECPPEQKKLV